MLREIFLFFAVVCCVSSANNLRQDIENAEKMLDQLNGLFKRHLKREESPTITTTTEPTDETEATTTESTTIESTTIESTTTVATTTEATTTEATSTEATSTEDTSTEATSTEATSTEATSTEATSTEATSTESTSTEATSTEATSIETASRTIDDLGPAPSIKHKLAKICPKMRVFVDKLCQQNIGGPICGIFTRMCKAYTVRK